MSLEETGLPFGFWFLVGLVTYVIIVLFCLWIRYCVLSSTLCPSSPCCVHCQYVWTLSKYQMLNCVDGMLDAALDICPKCHQQQSACSVFCCNRRHNLVDTGINFEFFKPTCSEIMCCCCRLQMQPPIGHEEDEYTSSERIELKNIHVQHI